MKAIAIFPIWNHLTKQEIPKGSEFEMDDAAVQSLIAIGQAKPVTDKDDTAQSAAMQA